MLRYKADIRTVIFMILLTALFCWNWLSDGVVWWRVVLACIFSISVTTVAHNHNHLQIWTNKYMNIFQDYWLTLFYGFPVFAWIPTHNKNHHKYNNREGDYTITYRLSEANNLATLLSYPSVSSWFQQRPITDYLKTMWRKRKRRFWYFISQYIILAAFIAVAFVIDWKKAIFYVVIPQQVALFAVLIFNYLQHVHADEESEWNHSRNVVGPVSNFWLFNNGFHTVHHMKPGVHWSETPALHKEVEHKIHPSLNEKSMAWLVFRVYILGLFFKRFRTDSMRLARIEHAKRVAEEEAAEKAASINQPGLAAAE